MNKLKLPSIIIVVFIASSIFSATVENLSFRTGLFNQSLVEVAEAGIISDSKIGDFASSFYRTVNLIFKKPTDTTVIVQEEIPVEKEIVVEEPEPKEIVKEVTQPITQTTVVQPIQERVIQTTVERVVSGVTLADLQTLSNELKSEIYRVSSESTTQSNNNYQAIALTNKIDNLSSVTINNSTITGGTITGATFGGSTLSLTGTVTAGSGTFSGGISGTTGSFSSNLSTSGQLTVSGTATSTMAGDFAFDTNTLYVDSVNNRVGIGSTSPSDTLAVNGPVYIAPISVPSNTTDRLYNVSNDLYWNGSLVGGGSVGNWTASGSDVYRTTGNVGVGTTTPFAKLAVENTGSGNSFVVGDEANDSSPFVITDSGDIAIGGTDDSAPFWFDVSEKKFEIGGTAVATSTTVCTAGQSCEYKCDGVSDNVQIQAAIDAVGANGTVELLEGVYTVSSGLTIPQNGVTLKGAGSDATKIIATGGAAAINHQINISGDDVTIRDLWLDGNVISANYQIVFENNTGGKVLNCKVGSSRTDGIVFGPDSDYGLASGNYLYDHNDPDTSGDGTASLEVEDGADNIILSNNIVVNSTRCFFPHTHDGFNSVDNITFVGNQCIGGADGNSMIIVSTVHPTDYMENIQIVGNNIIDGNIRVEGRVRNIVIQNNTASSSDATDVGVINVSSLVENFDISGNMISGGATYGLTIGGSFGSIEGNTVTNQGNSGIYLGSSSDHIIVIGNTLKNNGFDNYSYGVDVLGSNMIISNNIVEDTLNYQNVGIRLRSGGDNVSISNNSIIGHNVGIWSTDGATGTREFNNYLFDNGTDVSGTLVGELTSYTGLNILSGNSTTTGYISAGANDGNFNFTAGDLNSSGDLYIGGNIGIGTSSSLTKLLVQATAGNPALNIASSTGASMLYVSESGNVGVGTDSPADKLDVNGGNLRVSNTGTGASLIGYRTDGVAAALVAAGDSGKLLFDDSGRFSINSQSTSQILAGTASGSTEWFTLTSTGNIGIGTTSPLYKLTVNGTAAFTSLPNNGTGYYACVNSGTGELATSTTACGASSERFKENIQPLVYGLDTVLQLNPVSFDWKKDFLPNGTPQIGFIAEEVEQIIPEIIGYDDEGGVMNLDYPKLTSVVVNAIKEVWGKMQELIARVSGLESRLNELEARLQALEGSNNTATVSGAEPLVEEVELPTITIQGNNPSQIELNSTYVDMGVIAQDSNGNDLSVTVTVSARSGTQWSDVAVQEVDDEIIQENITVNQISLDTSTSTTYIITYSTTDNNGATASAEREVIIGAGNSQSTVSSDDTNDESITNTEELQPEEIASTTPEIIEEGSEESTEPVVEEPLEQQESIE